jgi:hypothetical protein
MPYRILIILVFICQGLSSSAQNISPYSLYAGVNYGGPIPTESIENSEGKPGIGFSLGGEFAFPLSGNWSLRPSVLFAYTHLRYGQTVSEDTLYAIEEAGGARVPTYYTADVDGRMQSLHMNISLALCSSYGRNRIGLGLYGASKLWHKDMADVRVVIGEGGFFDDLTEKSDNSQAINIFSGGLYFTYSYHIWQGWSLGMQAYRSLTPLYKTDNDQPGPDMDMYGTYVHLLIGYAL